MKSREGSRRFSDPIKRLAPGEDLRKFGWRRGVVCEKLCRRLQEFGKKVPGVQRVNVVLVTGSDIETFTKEQTLDDIWRSTKSVQGTQHIHYVQILPGYDIQFAQLSNDAQRSKIVADENITHLEDSAAVSNQTSNLENEVTTTPEHQLEV